MINKEFSGSVVETAELIDATISHVSRQYPNFSFVNFHREVAKLMPKRINPNIQIDLVKALRSSDKDVAAKARYSLVFISLPTIFSAVEDYFVGDEQEDEEVLHEAIFGAIKAFPDLIPSVNIKQEIYYSVQEGVLAYIAAREAMPGKWIREGWNEKVLDATGEGVIPWGISLTEGDIRDLSQALESSSATKALTEKYLRLKIYGGFREAQNDYEDTPIERVLESERRELLEQALGRLTDREKRVINLRFGFEMDYPLDIAKAAKILNLNRDRVRNIQAAALRKLGHYSSPLYQVKPDIRLYRNV